MCSMCLFIVNLRMCRGEHIYGIFSSLVVHFIQIFLALNANISGSLQLHVWSGL